VGDSGQAYWPAVPQALANVRLAAPGGFSAGFVYPVSTVRPDSLATLPRLLVPFTACSLLDCRPAILPPASLLYTKPLQKQTGRPKGSVAGRPQ